MTLLISWEYYKKLLNYDFNAITKKAVERGIKYRILTEKPKIGIAEHFEFVEILKQNNSSIRYLAINPPAILTIYDKKEVLIAMSEKANPLDTPLLCSNNSSIVSIANNYFENLWNSIQE